VALSNKSDAGLLGDPARVLAEGAQILLSGQLIEGDRLEASLEGHPSTLAVGRLDRPVGSLKLVKRRGLMAKALQDRVGRGVRCHEETTVVATLLDHVGTL
jgi:hypothetical protein